MEDFTRKKHIDAINKISHFGDDMRVTSENKNDYMNANLIDLTFDMPVYRIFKINRLISALSERKLCLVKPRRWDDPFENFLLKAGGRMPDGTPVSFAEIREEYYGQCWSLKKECDGLWRNYTSNSCHNCTCDDFNRRKGIRPISVKVKTNVCKLMNAFYDETNPFHSISYFMGKVRYCEMDDFVHFLQSDHALDTSNIWQILSLLMKRTSFSYEEEVRLIFSLPKSDKIELNKIKNSWDSSSDYFKFSIDPDDLFDEIEFDPWVNEQDYSLFSGEIRKYYQGAVTKSKLYDNPFFMVKL